MPSRTQNWLARHCTPPAPINGAVPACPCASCFNTVSNEAPRAPVYSSPATTNSRSTLLGAEADRLSLSSCDTYTTTSHVETVKPQ